MADEYGAAGDEHDDGVGAADEFIYSLQSFCVFYIIHVVMTWNGDGHRIE